MKELKKLKRKELELAIELHDMAFRKSHNCDCKRKVDYGNGDTYCEAMLYSRISSLAINNIRDELIKLQIDNYPKDIQDMILDFKSNKK